MRLDSFWKFVDRAGGDDACWPFTGFIRPDGYGSVHWDGKSRYPHRVAYALAGNDLAAGRVVRHTCDNPSCCNPAHLLIGSHKDNMQDAVRRGRIATGERQGAAKLTRENVGTIRKRIAEGISLRRIGAEFGVSWYPIFCIKHGRTWNDTTPSEGGSR